MTIFKVHVTWNLNRCPLNLKGRLSIFFTSFYVCICSSYVHLCSSYVHLICFSYVHLMFILCSSYVHLLIPMFILYVLLMHACGSMVVFLKSRSNCFSTWRALRWAPSGQGLRLWLECLPCSRRLTRQCVILVFSCSHVSLCSYVFLS